MLSKLEFVDVGRAGKGFKKGVAMDAKTQLVTVAVKRGKAVDQPALSRAIDDAGYDPIHLYTLEGGELRTVSILLKKE